MTADDAGAVRRLRFAWSETSEQLEAFAARFPAARADARGREFGSGDASPARLVVPFVLPSPRPAESAASYAARLPARIGRHCVVLLQAGAMAIGYWDEDELVRHKAQKRYVVRGNGKAQPQHLAQKGKSRYGSRLRLQNWRRLLADVNERLAAWWDELGEPEQVFASIPVRSRAALFAAAPPPPLPRDAGTLRWLPRHVHVPDHAELLVVRRWLARGMLVLPAE